MKSHKDILVAIVGLGRVGSKFLASFGAKVGSIKIVAAAERDRSAPGVEVASKLGVKVVKDTKELAMLGEKIDIIFDLSGCADTRKVLRSELARSGNQHTAIATETMAFLIWELMGEKEKLPDAHNKKGY
ncbi:MAG: Gfo/Idh/MocA family oxidoreductase [Deltaproteobacteria bacterium]|nr:Gfo/Idh/MocA family oxidoreductase [Deltaproteobacteria bacterium]